MEKSSFGIDGTNDVFYIIFYRVRFPTEGILDIFKYMETIFITSNVDLTVHGLIEFF